jgi:hypothetical protein
VCVRVFEKEGASFPRIEAPIPRGNMTVNKNTHPKYKKKKPASYALHAHPVSPMCTLHKYLTPSLINLNPIYFLFPSSCLLHLGWYIEPLTSQNNETRVHVGSVGYHADQHDTRWRVFLFAQSEIGPLCAPITRAHTFTSSSLHFASSASSSFRLGGGGCARTRGGEDKAAIPVCLCQSTPKRE